MHKTSRFLTRAGAVVLGAGLLLATSALIVHPIGVRADQVVSSATISSNNTNPSYAKDGDMVTLSFVPVTSTSTPIVSIDGHAVTPSADNGGWTATYPLISSDTEGIITFSIDFGDGQVVTSTTDGSSVTFDHTQPTVTLSSNAPHTTGDNPIPLTATFSEPVYGFVGTMLSVGNGTVGNFASTSASKYTFTVTPAADGIVSIDLNRSEVADAAGNMNMAAEKLHFVYDSSLDNNSATDTPSSGGGTGTTTPPSITFTSGPDNGATVSTSTVTFEFTTQNVSTTTCHLSSATSTFACSSPQTFSDLTNGEYTFTVNATGAHNATTSSSRSFTVNLNATSTSSTTDNSSGSSGGSSSGNVAGSTSGGGSPSSSSSSSSSSGGSSTGTVVTTTTTAGIPVVTGFQTGYQYHPGLISGAGASLASQTGTGALLTGTAAGTVSTNDNTTSGFTGDTGVVGATSTGQTINNTNQPAAAATKSLPSVVTWGLLAALLLLVAGGSYWYSRQSVQY